MKKIVRSVAMIALMFVAETGLAKEPKLSLTPNELKSLNFEMDAVVEQTLVRIVDSNGVVIYSENVTKANIYTKKFNLYNLSEGVYFLNVENALKETVFKFTIKGSNITIAERKENAKPIFRKKEERVFLNLLNLGKEMVKIKVMDSEGRIVFEETVLDKILVEKIFNFKEAFKDTYTVLVQDKNDTYSENIIVK